MPVLSAGNLKCVRRRVPRLGAGALVDSAAGGPPTPEFRDREEAEKELLAQKEYALAAVRRAAKGGDPEVVRRGIWGKGEAALPIG